MAIENFSANDKARLKDFITSSMKIFQEIDDLKSGLRDTAKTLAEEYDIKPAVLNKAARSAYKQSLEQEKDNIDTVESILHAAGIN